MKRKTSKAKQSFIAVLLAFCLSFSMLGTAFAAPVEDTGDDGVIDYVSLGASNTNGYGLSGYLPAGTTADNKATANVYGYQRLPKGSYPYLVAKALNEAAGGTVNGAEYTGAADNDPFDKVDINQLAMSSMRAEELRFLLDETYPGDKYTDWRFYDVNEDGKQSEGEWFSKAESDLSKLREVYAKAIADADVITVDIGVNNFGVYLANQLTSKMYGEPDLASVDPEAAAYLAEAKTYLYGLIAEYAPEYASQAESIDSIVDTLAYALVGFCTSFDVVMEKIYDLNPDATVVVVSIQNLLAGLDATVPGVDEALPLGDIVGALVNAANIYIAGGSPYADQYYCADVRKDGRVEFFLDQIIAYDGDLDPDIIDCFNLYDETLNVYDRVEEYADEYAASFSDSGEEAVAAAKKTVLEAGLPVAYDVVAQIMQAGAKVESVNLGAMLALDSDATKKIEDALMQAIEDTVKSAILSHLNDPNGGTGNDAFTLSPAFFENIAEREGVPADVVTTIAAMGVRTDIGNSFFGHPNRNGHVELSDAVLSALENGTAGSDILIDELIIAVEDVSELIEEYYDEAYKAAYEYASDKGYIGSAVNALNGLNTQLTGVGEKVANSNSLSAELKQELVEELTLAGSAIESLIGILNGGSELSESVFANILSLLDTIEDSLENLLEISSAAGDALNEMTPDQIAALEDQLKAIEEQVNDVMADAVEFIDQYIASALGEDYEKVVNLIVGFITEMAPEAAEWLYDYLMNNPNEVISFFEENADAIEDILLQLDESFGELIEFLLENYGDDALEYVFDNPEILGYMIAIIDEYGDEAWALIEVYAEALGLTDYAMGEYYDATNGDYVLTKESYYVAIGDTSITNAGNASTVKAYSEILAKALTEKAAEKDLAFEGDVVPNANLGESDVPLRVEEILYILNGDTSVLDNFVSSSKKDALDALASGWKAEIQKADLITVGMGSDNLASFAIGALGSSEAFDWARFAGEDGVKYVDTARSGIEELVSDVVTDSTVKGYVLRLVEALAYGYVGFSQYYSDVLNEIQAINPDATLVSVGMFNTVKGLVLEYGGKEIPLGEYAGYFMDLVDVQLVGYAALDENVTHIAVPDTDTLGYDADEEETVIEINGANLLNLLNRAFGTDTRADAAGHQYIASRILGETTPELGFLNVTVDAGCRITLPSSSDYIVVLDEATEALVKNRTITSLGNGVYLAPVGTVIGFKILLIDDEATIGAVKVNGTTLTADANGVYSFTVAGDSVVTAGNSAAGGGGNLELETDLAKATITLGGKEPSKYSVKYDAEKQQPTVKVLMGETELKAGTDYKLTYSNNIEVGKATVTITAVEDGAYTGSQVVTFSINHLATVWSFTDFTAKEWYLKEGEGSFDKQKTLFMDYALATGIMSGYRDPVTAKLTGYFGPYDNITRAQVAVVLYRAACNEDSKLEDKYGSTLVVKDYAKNTTFADMESGVYYTAAINWAKAEGVMEGDDSTNNTTVRPNDPVSREELALMLARYVLGEKYISADGSLKTVKLNASAAKGIEGLDDVSDWAINGVNWAINNGVMGGVDNHDGTFTLDPQGYTWRCAAAKMMSVTLRDLV